MARRELRRICALILFLAACTDQGEPYTAPTSPATTPLEDPSARLASTRAERTAELVAEWFPCPTERVSATRDQFPLAVAFVAPSPASREQEAALPLPVLGDEADQLRALFDHVATCGGVEIELHIHRDYTMGNPASLAEICDDVVANERNDLVISRGLPPEALRCVADAIPTLFIGDTPSDAGRWMVTLGSDTDRVLETLEADLRNHGMQYPFRGPIGVLHEPGRGPAADSPLADAALAEISDHPSSGCTGIEAAADSFADRGVAVIVSMLDFPCLTAVSLALKRQNAQWIISPVGVGTGDDALATISAVGATLDGAYAVTARPRGAISDRIARPPALGEECTRITATKGEDYEFGIVEYAALEDLCVAALLAIDVAAHRPGGADATVARLTSATELPWSSGLLAGFETGSRAAFANDPFYVQRYSSKCSCWTYVAGPIARA